MGYVLPPGISFCRIGERLVFLDVPSDRYFCLGKRTEESFKKVLSRAALDGADLEVLATLIGSRLLIPDAPESVPTACQPPSPAVSSLLDEMCDHVRLADVVKASRALAASKIGLRTRRFHTILNRLERSKANARGKVVIAEEQVTSIAHAFERTALLVASHDQCLARSIAVARLLLDLGLQPSLILGVKLRPFGAHCWVQHGTSLVNDHLDRVQRYTPILVI